jgi:hypothetical protein
MGAAGMLAMLLATAARAQVDLRPYVVEVEWNTPTGYERCAAVITARRPQGIEAWTAGHCAERPFSIVRFFDGYTMYGSRVRVLARSETVDAALLLLTVDAGRARAARPGRSCAPARHRRSAVRSRSSAIRFQHCADRTRDAGP